MKNRLKQGKRAGFTLIELLVVLIIIGLAASITVISLGRGGETNHQRFAQDLLLTLEQVIEEAVFTQKQMGVFFDYQEDESGDSRYSYTFLIYDNEQDTWLSFKNDVFKENFFPPNIDLKLEVEGENLVIGGERDNAISTFTIKKISQAGEKESKKTQAPDIVFFSSGETQAFKLTFTALAHTEHEYQIEANLLGHLKLILPGASND